MLKAILVIAAWFFFSFSYADLGPLSVSSYLGQTLNAKIPLTNLPANVDYNNLNIGLASGDKFKEYGLDFSAELGSLLFKVSRQGQQYYVQINSSKAFFAPVINILLHYQLDGNDFYRQYTILLDPIAYASQDSPKNNLAVPIQAPSQASLPLYHKKAKPAIPAKLAVYSLDLAESYVAEHLSNFKRSELSYITKPQDSLYTIARFEQRLYPAAGFSLNQVILALALKNYPQAHALDYPYESALKVRLANPQAIARINQESADLYLLDSSLTSPQRSALLAAIATSFDPDQKLTTFGLFQTKPVAVMVSAEHQPPLTQSPPVAESKPLDKIFSHLFWLFGSLSLITSLILMRKWLTPLNRMLSWLLQLLATGPSAKLDQKTSSNSTPLEPLADQEDGDNFTLFKVKDYSGLESADFNFTSQPAAESLAGSSSSVRLTPEVNAEEELIATLEQLLAVDASRDDIRFKLFELYLLAKQFSQAQISYRKLDERLASDDKLRLNVQELASTYGFAPAASTSELNNYLGNSL